MDQAAYIFYALVASNVVIVGVVAILLYPVVFPRIIRFPWLVPESESSTKDPRTVILAGSYNPPHHGHIAMLEYLAKRHKRVIAVVGFNPKKTYMVSPQARVDLLNSMLQTSSAKDTTDVKLVDGYIWRYAKANKASLFYRGIRSWEKDGKDERALQILNTWGPMMLGPLVWPIPTHFLEGDPKYNHISSTLIRKICSEGSRKEQNQALAELVPAEVSGEIADLYGRSKSD